MNIAAIRTLLGNDKIEEVLALLTQDTAHLSGQFQNTLVQITGQLNRVMNNKAQYTNPELNAERAKIVASTLEFAAEIERYINASGTGADFYLDHLVNDGRNPFIDRDAFRKMVKSKLNSDGAKIIFVKGDKRSGMSYLENFLIHIGRSNNLYNIIRINAKTELDNPDTFKGSRLAKMISIKLNLDLEFERQEDDQFKFTRFVSRLRERLEGEKRIPVVFLHDFHHLQVVPTDIYQLIAMIADSFRQQHPKTVFIVSGLDYELLPNWHTELKRFCCYEYKLEPVNEENIRQCLQAIFQQHRGKIMETLEVQEITLEQYIEGMLPLLIPKQPIDLVHVNNEITIHLEKLFEN